MHQVLSPAWEGDFSEHSYGFRPGRGARQAVKAAQSHVQSGKHWVVDMDLEVRERFRVGRGRELGKFIREELSPLLRGWANYFCLAEVKGVFEELDSWIRRKLRCAQWRQWKPPWTRFQRLRKLGFTETKAHASAWNGRGPWWNAGASHLNAAFGAGYYQRLGLVSLLAEVQWFSMKASL